MADGDFRRGVRLAPGVYSWRGEMHVDAVELCESLGVPPTERNQETAVRAALEVAGRGHGIPVEVRER